MPGAEGVGLQHVWLYVYVCNVQVSSHGPKTQEQFARCCTYRHVLAHPLAPSLADVTGWLPCLSKHATTRPETLPRDSRDMVCVVRAAIRLRAGKQATR